MRINFFTKLKRKEETELSLNNLETFLDAKPLFYDEIDYNRMPRIYSRIQAQLPKPKIIHIVGTNGKGTTGRFLSTALFRAGFRTGHYTSPHIMRFNERIWIDGADVKEDVLEAAHEKLQKILTKEESDSLSYFEYTTFLAMLCFSECEYVVLEAGLGGEYDATAVFVKILTVLTPVDKDHEAFLGESIEAITKTKLGAMAKKTLLAKQRYDIVERCAYEIAKEKGAKLYRVADMVSKEDEKTVLEVAKQEHLPMYLQENLQTAIAALQLLGVKYDAKSFANGRLFGRLSRIAPNIVVDVGHNPLAARCVKKALEGEKFVLVYNSYKDKDYEEILKILKPILKHVEIIPIEGERLAQKQTLQKTLKQLKIQYFPFEKIKKEQKYLVFGSFTVVEGFLKLYA